MNYMARKNSMPLLPSDKCKNINNLTKNRAIKRKKFPQFVREKITAVPKVSNQYIVSKFETSNGLWIDLHVNASPFYQQQI